MFNKILLSFVLICFVSGIFAVLLVQLKKLGIKSSLITYFLKERYIGEKGNIDKNDTGKNYIIFLSWGLFVTLAFYLFITHDWNMQVYAGIFFMSIILVIGIAKRIKNDNVHHFFKTQFNQNVSFHREYGEKGEISPQFREFNKLTKIKKAGILIDIFIITIIGLVFIYIFLAIILS